MNNVAKEVAYFGLDFILKVFTLLYLDELSNGKLCG